MMHAGLEWRNGSDFLTGSRVRSEEQPLSLPLAVTHLVASTLGFLCFRIEFFFVRQEKNSV